MATNAAAPGETKNKPLDTFEAIHKTIAELLLHQGYQADATYLGFPTTDFGTIAIGDYLSNFHKRCHRSDIEKVNVTEMKRQILADGDPILLIELSPEESGQRKDVVDKVFLFRPSSIDEENPMGAGFLSPVPEDHDPDQVVALGSYRAGNGDMHPITQDQAPYLAELH